MFDNNDRNRDHENGLYFSNRQLAWLLSGFIITAFFIFISGYFLGQKKGIERFSQKMDQENLADQVYSTMCALYDSDELLASASEPEVNEVSAASAEVEEPVASEQSESPVDGVSQIVEEGPSYYAQLVGFGSAKSADAFVQRLAARGIQTQVQKRQSKSAKGKISYWYQVITGTFNEKSELEKIVNRVKYEDKLHDVRIVQC